MVKFDCIVQEGCVDETLRPKLATALEDVCLDVLGADAGPAEFSWVVVKKGFGFRGGEPSNTSLVRGRIPDGCDRDTRERLLKSMADEWCRLTGATAHDLVISARDESWAG
jgi:hypothetical protein